MADTYALPRHSAETARLNEQHKYMTKAVGFLLHLRIPINGKLIRVADIACGSGIWLVDVAKRYPNIQCHGFDISSAQFPSDDMFEREDLQGRVSFSARDAADPDGPRAEYEGVFDIVAARLLHISLLGEQWPYAVKNLVAMLKPGGYVQWTDWDPLTARIVQLEPFAPKRGLDDLISGFQTFLRTRDTAATARLPEMLAQNHVTNLQTELYPFDVDLECRDYALRTFFLDFLPDVLRKVVVDMEDSGWDESRIVAAVEDARSDIKVGKAWMRFELGCHAGRKA